eukprot:s69_g6.t2
MRSKFFSGYRIPALNHFVMSVLFAASFNIVSSVSIILVNKQIASVCGFDFILTMLFLNFLTTATLLEGLAALRWFEKKHLPTRERWIVAGMALSTVLLNNCSNEGLLGCEDGIESHVASLLSWQDAVAGACAGAVAKTATAPMERVKLVLQNQQLSVGHAKEVPVRNLLHGMTMLLQEPMGFAGLWRGNLSNVMRVVPTYGARFWLFTYFDSRLVFVAQNDTRHFISGGLAGVGALLLTHPLDGAGWDEIQSLGTPFKRNSWIFVKDTVRTRLAAARIFADELSYRGFMDCVRQTWHRGGICGLYVGCLASMLEIAPYTAIAFTSYEGLKQRLLPGTTASSSIWCRRVFAGLCSGVAATTFCYPLDTVRRQLMLDGALGFDSRYSGSAIKSDLEKDERDAELANSVGFYQITKLLIIPTVIGLERLQGRRAVYSQKVILSIVVTGVGVALATVSDFEVNVRGSILALMSIISTAQYQIWQGSKQHEHGVTPTQITYSVAWPQSCAGLVCALLADVWLPQVKVLFLMRPSTLLEHKLSGQGDLYWIVLCNLLAVCTNISVYGLIGKTSPITYQVVGQLKTVMVVAFGYIFFDVRVPWQWLLLRFTGVAIAIVGVISYAIIKNAEAKDKKT